MVLAGLAAGAAGCGGGKEEARRDPFTAALQGQTPSASRKVAPRWERVATLAGTGDRTERVRISRRALPKGLGADAVRSAVIWYRPTGTAYIAAALER